ncbi:SAM-dependent methyltransferase [Stieleria mannarensis]|uniref:SAM-dependent methyltransferase n=1 Tax=Stieleria mannarensis TaxID=2755585 RepID=UPI001C7266A4|nr:SAM-dependent methyltransferase [Rhodopirellula sp. JC639]
MAVIETEHEVSWEKDYAERINPELMNKLLHRAVPVLEWTGWKITRVGPGFCESMLPLVVETTNQHGTHQAALISLSADYTGGMALTTLLTGTPLTGIHRGRPDESASLWLVGMDVKYENPSTSHLRAVSRVDPKTARRIQSRYFSGRVVLATIEVEFWSEDDERVAVAVMRYFAQATQKLLEHRSGGEQSPMTKLNLKTSARIIAGLRAMGGPAASQTTTDAQGRQLRIDGPHDHDRVAAGTHGLLQAKRLQKVLPQLGAMVGARTRHCDQVLRSIDGIEQIVMVGAGLDMRPIRRAAELRGATVFELDLPVMLAERQRVIEQLEHQSDAVADAPERHQIAADFLQDDVGELLQQHFAFSETALTLFIYEGCSMYFDEQQNQRLLRSIRRRIKHPQSVLWMDCVTPAVINEGTDDPNIHEFVDRMEMIGERFVYGPAEPRAFLRSCGFVCSSDVTAQQFLDSDDPTLGEYRFVTARQDVVDLD